MTTKRNSSSARHVATAIFELSAGFTLIQLLVAVAIVSVLAGIAYPSYRDQVAQIRRAEMQSELMAIARFFERRHSEFGCYDFGGDKDCSTADDAAAPDFRTDFDYYTVALEDGSLGPDTFTLVANPGGAQAGDGKLYIDHAQRRFWDENNDGDRDDVGEDNWSRN